MSEIGVLLLILVLLYFASQYHYRLFHDGAELFGVIVAGATFMVAWNSRAFLQNNYLLFVGIAYIFISILRVLHTLSYTGVGLFNFYEPDLSTKVWIASRLMGGASFLLAPLFLGRKSRPYHIFAAYALITGFLILSIYYWSIFPTCVQADTGLTWFDTGARLLISALFFAAIIPLYFKQTFFEARVLKLLVAALIVSGTAELAFVIHPDEFGAPNVAGHFLTIVYFYLIYKALIATGLQKPYELLFRTLKQSEESFRQSEARYRSLVELSPDAILVRCEGRYVYANGAAAALFGAGTPEKLVGKKVLDLIPPDERGHVADRMRELANRGEVQPLRESKILTVTDETVDVEYAASPITYHDLPATQVVMRDISTRKEAERVREDFLTRRRALIQLTAQVLAEHEVRGVLENVVAATRELTGARAAAAAYGRLDGHLEHVVVSHAGSHEAREDAEKWIRENSALLSKVLADEDSIRLDAAGFAERLSNMAASKPPRADIPKDLTEKGRFFGEIIGARLFGVDGVTKGFIMGADKNREAFGEQDETILKQLGVISSLALQHISARQHAERRAAETEEGKRILDALMAQIPEGITIADAPNGRIRMISRYGQELVGAYHPPDAASGFYWDAYQPDGITKPTFEELPLYRIINKGEIIKNEEWVLKTAADGHKISILCNAAPIRDAEGTITGGVVAWRDNTERKQAELALQRTAQELARSNGELEQFAYVASHDLQEPLRMISGYLQLLERRYKDKLDRDADDFINFAIEGSVRMQRLINDLLDYSRVGTRGKTLGPVDCNQALDKALANLRLTISETNAAIQHDPLPTVLADESQLIQLFQNLVGNAIKFRKTGMLPEIVISAAFQQGEISAGNENLASTRTTSEQAAQPVSSVAGHWRFSVKDNGIGMDLHAADRIFRIFQRLHTRDQYPGTGIGLAVCKKIIERHGGKIWVESEIGEGATFYFTLQRAEIDA